MLLKNAYMDFEKIEYCCFIVFIKELFIVGYLNTFYIKYCFVCTLVVHCRSMALTIGYF